MPVGFSFCDPCCSERTASTTFDSRRRPAPRQASLSFCPTARAKMSFEPPAANGTMNMMRLLGTAPVPALRGSAGAPVRVKATPSSGGHDVPLPDQLPVWAAALRRSSRMRRV